MNGYDFGDNQTCCTSFGGVLAWNPTVQGYECLHDDPDDGSPTATLMDEVCETFDLYGYDVEGALAPDPVQDPIDWSFDTANNLLEGIGGVVTGVLGIFGLFQDPPPPSYDNPDSLDQANDAKATKLFLGAVVVGGLIFAAVKYKRKK